MRMIPYIETSLAKGGPHPLVARANRVLIAAIAREGGKPRRVGSHVETTTGSCAPLTALEISR